MADINKTIKALTEWIEDPNAMNAEIDGSLVSDALELLKEQQTEIERLKQEKADAVKRVKELDIPCVGIRSYKAYMQGFSDAITKVIDIITNP